MQSSHKGAKTIYYGCVLLNEETEMTTIAIYQYTCTVCAFIRTAMVSIFNKTIAICESAGRARAASELARMGKMEEAKALMLEVRNARKN